MGIQLQQNNVLQQGVGWMVIVAVSVLIAGCGGSDDTQIKTLPQNADDNTSQVVIENTEGQELTESDTGDAQGNAQNAIPDSDIYLASMSFLEGYVEIGKPVNITNNPGYDNQPHFLPDNNTILFTSRRGKEESQQDQSDIYAYFIDGQRVIRMTDTPESEYSPTMTPSGETISVVRVEMDSVQRLWEFPIQPGLVTNKEFEVVFPELDRVGYHVWSDPMQAYVFRVDSDIEGNEHSLEIISRNSAATTTITKRIGRSLTIQPETGKLGFVDKSNSDSWKIKLYDPVKTLAVETLATPRDSEDLVWLDENHILMGKGNQVFLNTVDSKYGPNWQSVSPESFLEMNGTISRLAISPNNKWIAMVITK